MRVGKSTRLRTRGRAVADFPMPPSYAAVAHALRDEIIEQSERAGIRLDTPAGLRTLDTNSTLAPVRGRSLLRLLALRGAPPIAGQRVLDLGAGFGSVSLYFASLGAQVVAVDTKFERIELAGRVARRHQLPVRVLHADVSSLPLPDDEFDIVVANNSLCYVVGREARRRAFQEIARVCRPQGWFVMRNPNGLHPRDQFTALPLLPLLPPTVAVRIAERRGRPRSLVHLSSPRAAVRELRRAGFQEVRVESLGYPRPIAKIARYLHVVARAPGSTSGPANGAANTGC
jgi:demethylmenaquinone methyltransferase/2-methoxy-6-polyprenyl-1,4-benzoquinol methylase